MQCQYTYAVLLVVVISHKHGTSMIAISIQAAVTGTAPVTNGLSLVRSVNFKVNWQSYMLRACCRESLTNLMIKLNVAYITQNTCSRMHDGRAQDKREDVQYSLIERNVCRVRPHRHSPYWAKFHVSIAYYIVPIYNTPQGRYIRSFPVGNIWILVSLT